MSTVARFPLIAQFLQRIDDLCGVPHLTTAPTTHISTKSVARTIEHEHPLSGGQESELEMSAKSASTENRKKNISASNLPRNGRKDHDNDGSTPVSNSPEVHPPPPPPSNNEQPGCCRGLCGTLVQVAEWDHENKRITKLAFPYVVQALVEGTMDVVDVALVGHFFGTAELSAFVIVDLVTGLFYGILNGIIESTGTLCPQAIGVRNHFLVGQYIQ